MSCLVEGCKANVCRRGYCDRHYREALKSGKLKYAIRKQNASNATKHPLYWSWQGMIQRCTRSYMKSYKHYGGRGIKVCDRWSGDNGFWNFVNDMGERPIGTSLDRIDVNGDYCPENCRWAAQAQQSSNKRHTIRIGGKTVKEVATIVGLSPSYIRMMYHAGWTDAMILTYKKKLVRPGSIAVRCVETGEVFPSTAAADRVKKTCRGAISQCIKGKYKTAGGLHWEVA